MSSNIARILASEAGLSTTTTSDGLLDEARTRPQVPSSSVTRTPLTVTTRGDGLAQQLLAFRLQAWIFLRQRLDHRIFFVVGTLGRHGGRAPGLGQPVIQRRQLLAAGAVQHFQHLDAGDDAVVIAMADRRIEEEMAGLFEARQRAQFGGAALDIGMAGLPVIGLDAVAPSAPDR